MGANEIHVGDIGTVMTATIFDGTSTVDISSATGASSKYFLLCPPDTTTSVTVTASFIGGSGTNGVLGFTSAADTFTTVGAWKLQAWVTLGTGTFHSDVYKFNVFENLA